MYAFTFTHTPAISEYFDYILGMLLYNIEIDVDAGTLEVGFATLLYARVMRITHRILTLLARDPITIKRVPPTRSAKPETEPKPASPRKPRPRDPLPGRDGWLRHLLESRNSFAASRTTMFLTGMLQDPHITGRFIIDPGLAQALRTLCRMLGTTIPDSLRPPERPQPPLPRIPKPPITRKPREPSYHASLFEDLRTPPECVDHTWQPNRATPWRK